MMPTNKLSSPIAGCMRWGLWGAGFDTSFFRLQSKGRWNFRYIDVDFPPVMERKREIIGSEPSCSALATSGNYHSVSADLRDLSELHSLLKPLVPDFDCPTLFFSECAITYMDEPR